jgi:hypothetical protein
MHRIVVTGSLSQYSCPFSDGPTRCHVAISGRNWAVRELKKLRELQIQDGVAAPGRNRPIGIAEFSRTTCDWCSWTRCFVTLCTANSELPLHPSSPVSGPTSSLFLEESSWASPFSSPAMTGNLRDMSIAISPQSRQGKKFFSVIKRVTTWNRASR